LQLSFAQMLLRANVTQPSFMLLESSIALLENIHSAGVTHDDHHLRSSYFYSAGHSLEMLSVRNTLAYCAAEKKGFVTLTTGPLEVLRHRHRQRPRLRRRSNVRQVVC
jgi:hypothetical protein